MVLAHTMGCTLGGLILGVGLVAAQYLLRLPVAPVIVAAGVMVLAATTGVSTVLTGPRRQVSRDVFLRYSPRTASLRWGVELGAGVLTRFNTAFFVALVVAAVVQGDRLAVVAIAASYGALRGLAVAFMIARRRNLDARGKAPRPASWQRWGGHILGALGVILVAAGTRV